MCGRTAVFFLCALLSLLVIRFIGHDAMAFGKMRNSHVMLSNNEEQITFFENCPQHCNTYTVLLSFLKLLRMSGTNKISKNDTFFKNWIFSTKITFLKITNNFATVHFSKNSKLFKSIKY